jgi:thioredoxin-dependent peroxiredoxin
MEGQGLVIAKKAPDFTLPDHHGGSVHLYESLQVSPVLLVFYPGDFTMVCTSQLCNYRDNMEEFEKFGIQIFGISTNSTEEHKRFAEEYKFPFLLLTDEGQKVAKQYGCTSLLMLGRVSRAVFIVNSKGVVLYRYVEPTAITRRKADELIGILSDLRENKLI